MKKNELLMYIKVKISFIDNIELSYKIYNSIFMILYI